MKKKKGGWDVTLIPVMNEETRGRLGKALSPSHHLPIHSLLIQASSVTTEVLMSFLKSTYLKKLKFKRRIFLKAYHMVSTFKYILKIVAADLSAIPLTAYLHRHADS